MDLLSSYNDEASNNEHASASVVQQSTEAEDLNSEWENFDKSVEYSRQSAHPETSQSGGTSKEPGGAIVGKLNQIKTSLVTESDDESHLPPGVRKKNRCYSSSSSSEDETAKDKAGSDSDSSSSGDSEASSKHSAAGGKKAEVRDPKPPVLKKEIPEPPSRKHKSSSRSRSRSVSPHRKRRHSRDRRSRSRSKDRRSNKDRRHDSRRMRSKERKRSKERDSFSRHRETKSRRSRSRERRSERGQRSSFDKSRRSRSKEKSRKSHSKERSKRSRSRDKKKRSPSRESESKEKSKRSESKERVRSQSVEHVIKSPVGENSKRDKSEEKAEKSPSVDRVKRSQSRESLKRSESKEKDVVVESKERSKRSRSRERSKRSKSKDRSKRNKDRSKRSRSRERSKRSRSKDRSKRSRSRERSKRSRSKDRSKRSRSRGRSKRSRSKDRRSRSRSKGRRERRRSDRSASPVEAKVIKFGDRVIKAGASFGRPPPSKPMTFKEKMRQQLIKTIEEGGDVSQAFTDKDGTVICTRTAGTQQMPAPKTAPVPLMASLVPPPPGLPAATITASEAAIQSMLALQKETTEKTGVEIPKYYNPAAINPVKYAEQVQKRKLLWSKTKDKDVNTQWNTTSLSSDHDDKSKEKFRKLMGIKQESGDGMGDDDQDLKQKELFEKLDKEYQFARMATHTHRGVGLGFGSSGYQPPAM